jgi:hypothetical protein
MRSTPAGLIIPIDLKLLKATMPSTTPTTLDQIGAERTKVSERLARLDTERASVAARLTDLETAERVLRRVSKTPPSRRPTSAAAADARAPTKSRSRGQPPRAAASKSAGRKPSTPSLGERILALATGRTRQELYLACPNDRPNHIGIAVQRHLRAGRIQERDGKLYATSSATEQARGTA